MLRRAGTLAGARYVVTDRYGGVSSPPYGELNLGDHVGDDPAAVAENRRRVALTLDLTPRRLVLMAQEHGSEVAVVTSAPGAGEPSPVADALVTDRPGLGLVVLVADCVPVLLAAEGGGVVAVAHAGRRGVEAGVVSATVAAMTALGARPEEIKAIVGPAVCGRCYEVPGDLAEQVVSAESATRATSRSGRPALDLPAGVVAQLRAAGVGAIEADRTCTAESPDLYSYRRDGVTGRFAAVVVA
jgi:purine-nucleoside/S-methyl-5'-thioadenosine phosphorylase / adenosine deaminase